MPRKVSQAELDAVFQAAARFPEGAAIEEISGVLEISLPHRTLQRHLARLVDHARLTIEGRGRGSRYRLLLKESEVLPSPSGLAIKVQATQVEHTENPAAPYGIGPLAG